VSCCRGPRATSTVGRSEGPFCAALEQGGANFEVQVVTTRAGLKLVTTAIVGGKSVRLDVLAYLQTYRCQGPVGVWLAGELPKVASALHSKPELFTPYMVSGATLAVICKLARSK